MRAVIIEDEPYARKQLARLLSIVDSDVQIVGYFDTVQDCTQRLLTLEPELIFMDIQLADGSSFEIFEKIKIECPVIFTTAYDEFAISAFKVNGIDYLLKPVDENGLKNALQKYRWFFKDKDSSQNILSNEQIIELSRSLQKSAYKSRLMISVGDRIRFIIISEIAYFFAEGNTVYIVSADSGKFIIDYSLEELSKMLDPAIFFRVSRSFLVNIGAIKEVRKYFNSRLKIYLKPETSEELLISRIKVESFLDWLNQ